MYRVGTGYDLHRLVENHPLILGGERLPFHRGLEGHSDADVLLHAIMDALLGAASLGDIGHHFPPGEERFRLISSMVLLEKVKSLLDAARYTVINIDAVVIAEEPKLAPHIGAMKENISAMLEIDLEAVSIKATTTEGVGDCGRGEAIAAQAVVLLQRKT